MRQAIYTPPVSKEAGAAKRPGKIAMRIASAKRLGLLRLRSLLAALGRLAVAERMNTARAEIERGRERLWLRRDGEEEGEPKG